jgi:hypothetical protein
VLPLSKVSARPELYTEPHRLELTPEGLGAMIGRPDQKRQLEVQVFMSSRGQLAATARQGGSISVLAATWNVGNAYPPPPEQLAALWLRGADAGAHHLVAVSAQECSYLKDARAARAKTLAEELPSFGSSRAGGADVREAAAAAADDQRAAVGNGSLGRRAAADSPARAKSPHSSAASAAAGARYAADMDMDEDDEKLEEDVEDFGSKEGRARISRARSLKGRLSQNIDSASDWVGGGLGRLKLGLGRHANSGIRHQPCPSPPDIVTPPPCTTLQESLIAQSLGPRYWLVGAKHMFQTRTLVFARMDVVPFITK